MSNEELLLFFKVAASKIRASERETSFCAAIKLSKTLVTRFLPLQRAIQHDAHFAAP